MGQIPRSSRSGNDVMLSTDGTKDHFRLIRRHAGNLNAIKLGRRSPCIGPEDSERALKETYPGFCGVLYVHERII